MPSRTDGATATAKRFELPALDLKFTSLTDGTDIPPPPPSPIREEPKRPNTPPKETKKEEQTNGASKTNGNHATISPQSATTTAITSGVKRPADDYPASPTHSARPSSIRRLFSRNLLNSAYANGEAEAQGNNSIDGGSTRPESRSNGSFVDDRKAKRSSGWFRRLRGSDSAGNKRSSQVFDEVKKPAGPPPPMIPELAELEAKLDLHDEGSLGSDLFKNIK